MANLTVGTSSRPFLRRPELLPLRAFLTQDAEGVWGFTATAADAEGWFIDDSGVLRIQTTAQTARMAFVSENVVVVFTPRGVSAAGVASVSAAGDVRHPPVPVASGSATTVASLTKI